MQPKLYTRRPLSKNALAHLLLLGIVMLWGTTFVVVKQSLSDISPLLFNLVRMTIAFTALAFVYRRHFATITRTELVGGALVGLCLAIGYQFQTSGLLFTTPSKSAFITGMVVIFVPLFSILPAFRAPQVPKPGLAMWLGATLAFIGLGLLTIPAGISASRLLASMNRGDLLTIGCAVGFALHILMLSRTATHISFEKLAILQTGFCAIFIMVTEPILEKPLVHWTPALVLSLAITGLLATALAFAVQSWAQRYIPAANTSLFLALEPIFAWITSWLVLGERLSRRAGCGAVFVIGGILIIEFLPRLRASRVGARSRRIIV